MRSSQYVTCMKFPLVSVLLFLLPSIVLAEWNTSTLMHELALSDRTSVSFTETKTLSYLDGTLTSEGLLSIAPSGVLTKETLKPIHETLKVDQDAVTVVREGKDTVEIALSDYPIMQGFIEAFRATIQGDLDSLSHYYALETKGEREAWSLQLEPLQSKLLSVIRIIDIKGSGDMINSFMIEEQGGDSTLLLITGQ